MRVIYNFLLIGVFLVVSSCGTNKVIDIRTNQQSTDSALLHIPIELDLVHHNRRSYNTIQSYQEIVTYRLSPGKQVLGLQYRERHTNTDGEKETIKSHIVEIIFTAERNRIYHINFDKPKTFEQALEIEKKMELGLYLDDKLVATSKTNDVWQLSSLPEGLEFTPPTEKPGEDAQASQHLLYWWSIASEDDKQHFLQSIRQQASHLE